MTSKDISNLLKSHIRAKDVKRAYDEGRDVLAKDPSHEVGAYAAAWGAFNLGNYDEVLRLIEPALSAKPTNFIYISLRARAFLKLGRYAEALPDFHELARQQPNTMWIWVGLRTISRELNLSLPLPRNFAVVTEEMSEAYKKKDWEACQQLIPELKRLAPFTAAYWDTCIQEDLLVLPDPQSAWRSLHEEIRKTGKDGEKIAFPTFRKLVQALIKAGATDEVMAALPGFKRDYGKPCPSKLMTSISALLIGSGRFPECLSLLSNAEIEFPNAKDQKWFRLRTYASRWYCEKALSGEVQEVEIEKNDLSESLSAQLISVCPPETSRGALVSEFDECWNEIRKSSSHLWLDVRYSKPQKERLRLTIAEAINARRPLSLIRLGDGESYGFQGPGFEPYPNKLAEDVERVWWGRGVKESIRQELASLFRTSLKNADIIGFPGPLRMVRDLVEADEGPLTMVEAKYLHLFRGMQRMLLDGDIARDKYWTDEFCNFLFADWDFLRKIKNAAERVVVVSCFEIPDSHPLSGEKTTLVRIPPEWRAAQICGHRLQDPILPDRLSSIMDEVRPLVSPGALLLVSAGFAGKCLLELGREVGAVSLDFGAALDETLGLKTRALELHAQSSISGTNFA
jgi:tetratricopeptide (TPR) repeat protein